MYQVPQLLNELVVATGAFKDQIVAAGVGPVVGLAIADEEQAGPIELQIITKRDLQERVVDILVIEPGGGAIQLVQQLLTGSEVGAGVGSIPGNLHGDVAARFVENVAEGSPGGEDVDLVVKFRLVVKPLENGDVRIGAELVGVDAWIR